MITAEDAAEPDGIRFSLRTLMIGVALAAVACFVLMMVLEVFDVPGTFADLPSSERQALHALETIDSEGIRVLDSRADSSCSFDRRCRVLVRSVGQDRHYHVTAVQLHGVRSSESARYGEQLRKFPELRRVRLLPGHPLDDRILETYRRELPDCQVEYITARGDW
ncbi:MAG TPA: hypothetical protein VHB99_15870 [Pirellulales bacterium]|nr:hypothetical protein [Pirellulales bacterium]